MRPVLKLVGKQRWLDSQQTETTGVPEYPAEPCQVCGVYHLGECQEYDLAITRNAKRCAARLRARHGYRIMALSLYEARGLWQKRLKRKTAAVRRPARATGRTGPCR